MDKEAKIKITTGKYIVADENPEKQTNEYPHYLSFEKIQKQSKNNNNNTKRIRMCVCVCEKIAKSGKVKNRWTY